LSGPGLLFNIKLSY